MIAVDTPRLWCDVAFSLRSSRDSELLSLLIPRIRHVPTTITLRSFDEAGGNRLKQCNLQRIPVISTFVLELIDPEYFNRIKELPRFLPKHGVEQLKIRHITVDDTPDEVPPGAWDIGDLLENIPAVMRLELCSPCELIVTPSTKLATITSLTLQNTVNVDILGTVSLLPNLSRLDLHDVGFTPALETTQVVSTSLKTLKLGNFEENSWLSRLACPNLDTLLADGVRLWEACASFVKAHNSITHLDIYCEVNLIAKLASIAPQAQVLAVEEGLSLLYKRKAPRVKGSRFPFLKRLIVDTMNLAMTLQDFEGVVTARCLPRTHRLSKLTASLEPLTALCIRRNSSDPMEEQWRDSELFQSAEKTTEQDPYWESWELLNLSWV